MPTSFTTNLRLSNPGLGDTGWGSTVSNGMINLTDQAIAGTTTLSTDADVTLTTANGITDQARQMILNCTGSRGAQRTITAPASSKAYVVINSTTGGFGVKIVGVGPTTGVVVPAGRMAVVAWNGSDFVTLGAVVDLTASGNVTLTALTASTALALDANKQIVSVTNTGTGDNVLATSPILVTPNLGTPSAATLTNATGLPIDAGTTGTLSAARGGTGQTSYAVGDIIYASSTTALSKLTVGATNAVLTVAAGIPSWVATLPVASGGTGAATLAANNVLLGNGTSAVQTVAPGTAGNLLTSNGTTWTSATPAAASVTSVNGLTGAVSMTGLGDIGSYAVLIIATNTNLAAGATVAGSDLRHSWTPNTGVVNATSNGYSAYGANRSNSSASYTGGGTSLTGTWRKVSTGATYGTVTSCCVVYYYWMAALYVRIS